MKHDDGIESLRRRRRTAGSALVPGLVAVTLVFGLSMAYLQVSTGISKRLRGSVDRMQAFELAEAGLAEAYAGLTIMKTGNVGTAAEPATIGNGLFWVETTDLGGGLFELESTALYGTAREALGMVVRREAVLLGSLGMFSSEDLILPSDAFVDSYDSSLGTYGEQVAAGTNTQTVVGSNGSIELMNGAEVLGDLVYGPSGAVSAPSGTTVTGVQQARAVAQPLPDVELPTIPLAVAQSVGSGETLVLPPGEHGFQGFDVENRGRAIVTGPATVLVGGLSLATNSELIFDNSGGAIDLFVTGDLDMGPGSIASTVSDDPDMVTLQLAGDETTVARLGANASFFGQIYAPRAEVEILPDFEVFGSVVANLLNLSPLARLHLDVATIPTRRDALPTMWSWRVVEVPQSVAAFGGDPFALFGVDRDALPAPAEAHQDQTLSVTYVDASGATKTYDGWESAFDWTQVSEVLIGKRDGDDFRKHDAEGEATAEPSADPLTAEEQTLIDRIASAATSADLYNDLVAAYPVTERVLLEAINRVPPMDSADLYWVMIEYGPQVQSYVGGRAPGPAPDPLLMALIQQADFESTHLGWVLDQNSPLTTEVLDAAIARVPAMKTADLNMVLRAQ